jgi:AcrR family transcriptional regulator
MMHRKPSAQAGAATPRIGRARDNAIDARILAAARRQLSALGYEAMSVASVAQEAGTTRQALYRRWPSKAELADAAVAAIEDLGEPVGAQPMTAPADDPFRALLLELEDFQRGVSRPGRLSLAGTMLQETTDPDVRGRYQGKVITPRRRRIRAILEHAAELGLIDAGADLEVAVAMATGNWYGRALAGDPVPADWPRRSAELVWRAVGGRPPQPPAAAG